MSADGDELAALFRIEEELEQGIADEYRDPEVLAQLADLLRQCRERIASRIPNHPPEPSEVEEDVEYRTPRSSTLAQQAVDAMKMAEVATTPEARAHALTAVREARSRLEAHRNDVTVEMAMAISEGRPTSTARIDSAINELAYAEENLLTTQEQS